MPLPSCRASCPYNYQFFSSELIVTVVISSLFCLNFDLIITYDSCENWLFKKHKSRQNRPLCKCAVISDQSLLSCVHWYEKHTRKLEWISGNFCTPNTKCFNLIDVHYFSLCKKSQTVIIKKGGADIACVQKGPLLWSRWKWPVCVKKTCPV